MPAREADPFGVNVIGFHAHHFGIARAGRLMIEALDAAGVPLTAVEAPGLDRPEVGSAPMRSVGADAARFPINLLCMNGNHVLSFAAGGNRRLLEDRYTIALWFWETDRFPAAWQPALDLVDELWVPSAYVAATLEQQRSVPVTRIRLAVTSPRPAHFERGRHGIRAGDFLFCYLFEYGSSGRRKNPLGLIEAFTKAFPAGSGASLLLKSSFAENEPEHARRVGEAATAHPDVHVVDGRVSEAEKDAIVAGCDCYVSLQRSEGFGLTQAEAISLGKPVIATGYGGSMEFMTPDTAYLVDYELERVGEGEIFYAPDDRWASPDTGHAAKLMREVFEDPERARERAAHAAERMRNRHSPEAAGRIVTARLEEIWARLPQARGVSPLAKLRRRRVAALAKSLRRERLRRD